jgi:uncharacterized protein (DUF1501 family)
VRKLDDRFGLNPGMSGFERLWKDGRLAIVHGCGYDNPSFSHFTSMAYWHTAAPNSGDDYGWSAASPTRCRPKPVPNYLINVDATQSLAVRSRIHTPVVFDEPDRFVRSAFHQERALLDRGRERGQPVTPLPRTGGGQRARIFAGVRDAWSKYKTPVRTTASTRSACPRWPPASPPGCRRALLRRLSQQRLRYPRAAVRPAPAPAELHVRFDPRLPARHGTLGQADRVSMLIFSEFGRRVPENTSLGTDHGTANVMFFAGKRVKGGHYGTPSDLGALDAGDNLVHTTDFRSVYASAIDGWLKAGAADKVLKGRFVPVPVFG